VNGLKGRRVTGGGAAASPREVKPPSLRRQGIPNPAIGLHAEPTS
jgi:hypothetical protein